MLARDRDAGRVDLREARIGEARPAAIGAPDRGDVAALGVGREVVDVAVAAGGQDHRVGGVRADRAGHEVAHHDAAREAVDHHQVEHLGSRVHLDCAEPDLPLERLIRAQKQLLSGLATSVEGARNLRSAEGAIREQAAVLAREGDALRDALIDDADRALGQAMHVRLARAVVAPLHRVVEEAPDAVAVVLIVLGGVDAALGRDRVRAPRRILEAEGLHLVAELGQRGGRGPAGEAGPDHDHRVLPLVRRIDQLHVEPVTLPLRLDGTAGNLGVEFHRLS